MKKNTKLIYEILSFIATKAHGYKGYILTIKEIERIRNVSNTPEGFTLKGYLENKSGFWDIHSIKRLSDDEVFTVDKYICHSYTHPEKGVITKDYKIERIYFIEENRLAFYVGGGLNLGIKNMSKRKEPLFTTDFQILKMQ